MDTAQKIADLAHERGLELVSVGVAKTIDNDVGDPEMKLVDHTPGYGSTARFWALNLQNLEEENRGFVSGRSRNGRAGDGPEDRIHPGGGEAGRSGAPVPDADLHAGSRHRIGRIDRPGE